MTQEKEKTVPRAKSIMDSARFALDEVMYGDVENPLSECEFKKVRAAYDKLCQAIDELP